MVTKIKINQHTRILCGKTKKIMGATVIWHCGSFTATVAGGSWVYNTTSTVIVNRGVGDDDDDDTKYPKSKQLKLFPTERAIIYLVT